MRISVIIPCLRDTAELRLTLANLRQHTTPQDTEVLIADGGTDCLALAQEHHAKHIPCPEIGRGPQMHHAARQATGDVLVFLHADTQLTKEHLAALRSAFQNSPISLCGAFYRDFAWQYPRLAWLADFSQWWQREVSILYGDQTHFFRTSHYHYLGGYPAHPLMEDVAMSDAMRTHGGLILLHPPMRTSLRRFQKLGWWQTKLRNLSIIAAYRLGVSPARLYRWYYGC